MMLEQIEKKQAAQMEERDTPKPKTIGVKTPPELYARLTQLKKAKGLKSLKEAMLLAAEKGCDELL